MSVKKMLNEIFKNQFYFPSEPDRQFIEDANFTIIMGHRLEEREVERLTELYKESLKGK